MVIGTIAARSLTAPSLTLVSALFISTAIDIPVLAADGDSSAEPYFDWSAENLSITAPIGGKRGNPQRGRQLSIERKKGNCIACHLLPIAETEFPGELGPALTGVGSRLSAGEIRLRVVDAKQANPFTIMPGYYRHPKNFNNVKKKYRGKTLLSAQEIEDLVAYLVSLK